MLRSVNRRRHRYLGSLIGGLILIELGLLQFFHRQFLIEWSELWPILLTVPGLTLVLGSLVQRSVGQRQKPNGN